MFKKFRALFATAILALTCAAAGSAGAQSYLPVGPQIEVQVSEVTGGGWTECFRETYGTNGTPLSTVMASCGSSARLMLACRTAGSPTLQVLAQGPTADVTAVTVGDTGVTNSNGSAFYYNGERSWGFAKAGDAVSLNSCDTENAGTAAGEDRLCWHTGGNSLNYGYRCGNTMDSDYERIVYRVSAAPAAPVPTLSEWAMILLGVTLAGGAALYIQRRKLAS